MSWDGAWIDESSWWSGRRLSWGAYRARSDKGFSVLGHLRPPESLLEEIEVSDMVSETAEHR